MNRFCRYMSALLVCFLALGISLQAQEHKKKNGNTTHQESETAVYTCAMHPDVKSDKPGKCPKCGMSLVKLEAVEARSAQPQGVGQQKATAVDNIKAAKRLLMTAKSQLTREGKYDCCIEEPCNQCALDHQSCPCYNDVKAGKPVCNECYGGWQRGEGKDRKIDPKSVKTTFSTHKH